MLLTDSRGHRYQLSRVIGKGGQATVYRVAGSSTHLAKIYTQPRPEDEKKLTWMVANPPDDPSAQLQHASIAWPTTLLYKPDQTFAGYLMPYVRNAVAALNVFNPRLRARTLPEFDIRYLHRTARNLAAALGALHARDYVVGDLNESNVMVTPATLVTMIDTDSFQVRATPRGKPPIIYPCPVGKFEYLPPELQAQSLKNVYRLPEHDRFALSVLIFQLLMDGNHPFRAKWNRPGEVPLLEERIRAGWYPYRDGSARERLPVSPPDNAPDLAFLHPAIVNLFQQCFILGHVSPSVRPFAEDWEKAIAQAEKALKPCGRGHYYSTHLAGCPYCALDYPEVYAPPVSKPTPKLSPEELLANLVAEHLVAERAEARAALANASPANVSRPNVAPTPSAPTVPRAASVPMPVSSPQPITPDTIQRNLARLFVRWMNGLPGKVAAFGLLGMAAGAFFGGYGTGPGVGQVMGIAGGMASGAMFSEAIEKRCSWAVTLGIAGAVTSAFLVWQSGFPMLLWTAAGMLGGVVGFMAGVVGRPTFWVIVWAALGAWGGSYFGRIFGGAIADPSAGGALSGALFGALTGVMYWAWRKFG
jgi:serine/threonine protein kinase